MAKGQRIGEKQIEVMRAYLAAGSSLSETARKMGLPKSTVATWKKRFKEEKPMAADDLDLEQARPQKGAPARVGDGRAFAEQKQHSCQGREQRTFEELRTFNQERFIEDAGEIVAGAQSLIKYNLEKAFEQREKIDKVIELLAARGSVLTDKELRKVLQMLLELKTPDIGKLSSVMGTMYDKRALARGEPTENLGGVVKFENM